MTIEHWRTEIDEIDRELLRLLNRRARLAMKVGALKKNAGLPCCDEEREHEVLTRLQQANGGPLDSRAIAKLFRPAGMTKLRPKQGRLGYDIGIGGF